MPADTSASCHATTVSRSTFKGAGLVKEFIHRPRIGRERHPGATGRAKAKLGTGAQDDRGLRIQDRHRRVRLEHAVDGFDDQLVVNQRGRLPV